MREAMEGELKTSAATQDANPLMTVDEEWRETQKLEMAHVLFMDIVGYSKQHIEKQTSLRRQLKTVVRNASEFQRAQKMHAVISRSTGDGMALVFFGDPEAPARCALEISRILRKVPALKLRMGLHSGPVYRDMDVNDELDVAGGGINMAQRVMDCGDAGHILVSRSMAETLTELSRWENYLHDLGRVEVKHGKLIHVFNLYDHDFGNSETPERCRDAELAPSTLALNARQVARLLAEQKQAASSAAVTDDVTAYRETGHPTRFVECVRDDARGHRILYLPDGDISVCEDRSGETPVYFAWNGTAADSNRNHHTANCGTMDEAIDEAIGLRYATEESDAL
jgi:class 3 adenylate cyclase